MAVDDKKIHPNAAVALKPLRLTIASVGASQSDVRYGSFMVPFGFEVVKVYAWARAKTGTPTVKVKVGSGTGTDVLTAGVGPATGTTDPATGTLVTSRAARRGRINTPVHVHFTSAGGEALTDVTVVVWIRAFPLNGEPGATS